MASITFNPSSTKTPAASTEHKVNRWSTQTKALALVSTVAVAAAVTFAVIGTYNKIDPSVIDPNSPSFIGPQPQTTQPKYGPCAGKFSLLAFMQHRIAGVPLGQCPIG